MASPLYAAPASRSPPKQVKQSGAGRDRPDREGAETDLRELTTEFGGSAKAAGDTLPGKINILKESLRNWRHDRRGSRPS